MSQVTGLSRIPPQTFYRYNKPEARPYVVVAQDPQHGDFGPFTPDTKTAGLQEAINYVAGQGGGTVHVARGTYLISAQLELIGLSNITVEGEGWPSVLQLNPAVISTTPPTGIVMFQVGGGAQSLTSAKIKFRDIVLDGNQRSLTPAQVSAASASSSPGIWATQLQWTQDIAFEDVVFYDWASGGTWVPSQVGGTLGQYSATRLAWRGCRFENNSGIAGGGAIQLESVRHVTIEGNMFVGVGENPALGAVSIQLHFGSITDVVISDNIMDTLAFPPPTVYGAIGTYANTQLSHVVIEGNTISNYYQPITVSNAVVEGNVIENVAGLFAILSQLGGGTVIEGNRIANCQQVGIQVGIGSGAVSNVVVRGNYLQNIATSGTYSSGYYAIGFGASGASISNVVIEGNMINQPTSGLLQYGIFVANNTFSNVKVSGNVLATPANVATPYYAFGLQGVIFTFDNVGFGTPVRAQLPNPLASGTTYQNIFGQDIVLFIPVNLTPTSSAAASATISVGSSPSTLSAVQTVSAPAGATPTQQVLVAQVPNGQYFQLTLTNASTAPYTVLPSAV